MKRNYLLLAMLATFSFFSCGGSGNDEPDVTVNTGVHKIVLEIKGDASATYTASFAGTTAEGIAKLYDVSSNYKGDSWVVEGNVMETNKVTCHTGSDGEFLACQLTIGGEEIGKSVTYSLKAYINDKLVAQVEKTITFTTYPQVETVQILTVGN